MEDLYDPDQIAWLFDQLWKTQLFGLLWDSMVWALFGSFLGFVFGLGLFFVIRAFNGYRWEWEHAKWIRVIVAIAMAVGGLFAGGSIGVLEGTLRGGEDVLRKSQLATEVFPVVGDAGADLLVILDDEAAAYLDDGELADQDEIRKHLVAFEAGERELDVGGIGSLTNGISDTALTQSVALLRVGVLEDHPDWRDSMTDKLLTSTLERLGKLAIMGTEAASGEAGDIGGNTFDTLPAVAAEQGDPVTISREELSAHLVQQAVVPSLLVPIALFIRGQQKVVGVLTLLLMLLPILGFRLAEYIRVHRAGADAPRPLT